MQVRELTGIEALHTMKLLSGEGGLDNSMKDVVLLEYESLKQETSGYYRDDFIVSTLYFSKDDPETLLPVVERLIDLGAAGLAFKSSYYQSMPSPVLALARARDFPIFMFDELYMEDVILSISDYIRLQQEFSLFEEPLSTLLYDKSCRNDTERMCSRMNPGRKKYMCAAYIHAPNLENTWYVTLRDALRMRSARELSENYRFLQFRRGFFILFNDTQPQELSSVLSQCRKVVALLGCDESQLCFGVGDSHQNTADFDCVIREAFDALLWALAFSAPHALFSELHFYRMIFPILRDKSARAANRAFVAKLDAYDQESGTGCLLQTLQSYSNCGYDIRKTASAMHQHPNTIRYRLKKIGSLIGSPDNADEAIFLLGEFMRLDALRQLIF